MKFLMIILALTQICAVHSRVLLPGHHHPNHHPDHHPDHHHLFYPKPVYNEYKEAYPKPDPNEYHPFYPKPDPNEYHPFYPKPDPNEYLPFYPKPNPNYYHQSYPKSKPNSCHQFHPEPEHNDCDEFYLHIGQSQQLYPNTVPNKPPTTHTFDPKSIIYRPNPQTVVEIGSGGEGGEGGEGGFLGGHGGRGGHGGNFISFQTVKSDYLPYKPTHFDSYSIPSGSYRGNYETRPVNQITIEVGDGGDGGGGGHGGVVGGEGGGGGDGGAFIHKPTDPNADIYQLVKDRHFQPGQGYFGYGGNYNQY